MHDLATIKARNARAMKDADKYGMGRRPDPHLTLSERGSDHKLTASQIAAREALIAAALDWCEWGDGSVAKLATAVEVYRKAYNT